MRISYDVYNIFYYVCKFKSITKAANYLHVSQPAITRHIKNLELYLGVTLFVRAKNGLELTLNGETLYNEVKNGIEIFNLIESNYNEKKKHDSGEIKILAGYTTTKKVLLPLVLQFNKKYPKVKFKLGSYPFHESVTKLRNGEVDLIFLNLGEEEEYNDLIIKKIYELQDILVVNSKYKFLYPDILEIKNINDYPIICKSNYSITKNFISEYLRNINIKFEPLYELTDHWLVEEYINMNMGIGIISKEFILEMLESKEFVEIKTDIELPKREIGYAIRKSSVMNPALTSFIKVLNEHNFFKS